MNLHTLPPIVEMQRAYLGNDASYNGIFYLGVRTTGIFCKPQCPAPVKPLPKNVEYFATVKEATFAGYRPCKRCRPLTVTGAPVWAQKLLAQVEQAPQRRLREWDLRQMGIEPARARRYFQRHFGMSFNAYQRGRRMSQAFTEIRNGAGVDGAALDHGYASASGFREAFGKLFGQAPRAAATAGDCILLSWYDSPLGPLILGANAKGLCLLEFSDRRMLATQFKVLRARFNCAVMPGENAHLKLIKRELNRYFAGELQNFSVPLIYPGTGFQETVWRCLLQIPYGETRSYEDLARAVGSPKAVRAVGTANGCNRMAIVIPCHRVVNKGGKLGGYGGGLWRKQALLDLEQGKRRLQFANER